MKTAITCMLVVCLVPFLTGCEGMSDYTLTGRLWDSESGPFHNGPATPPNLKLYQDGQHGDILVQYDEVNDNTGALTRRAYLLEVNRTRINAFQKPRFITLKSDYLLDPIPVETNSAPVADATNHAAPWAQLSADGHAFTLFSDGEVIGPCHLPAYGSGGGMNHFDRVMLTPVTVVGDVVIYSAIAAMVGGVVFGLFWLESRTQTT